MSGEPDTNQRAPRQRGRGMAYEIQWTLAVIGGCIASGALLGIVCAVIREVQRG